MESSIGSKDGVASYDFEKLLINRNGIRDYNKDPDLDVTAASLFHTTVVLHEDIHWIQHGATSTGAFLTLLQGAQDHYFMRMMPTIAPEDLSLLKERRQRGHPILEYEEFLRYRDLPEVSEETNQVRRVLHCLYSAYSSFLNLSVHADAQRNQMVPSPEAMQTAMNLAYTYLERKYDTDQSPDGKYDFTATDINWVQGAKGIAMDTMDLFEQQAVLLELANFRRIHNTPFFKSDYLEQQFQARYDQAWASRYFEPMRTYLLLSPKRLEEYLGMSLYDKIDQIFPTVHVLLDFALNPPLPPYADRDIGGLGWEDIYPPVRFYKLCEAAERVGRLSRNFLGHSTALDQYRQLLIEDTGLAYAGFTRLPDMREDPLLNGVQAIIDTPDILRVLQDGGMDYVDLLFYLHLLYLPHYDDVFFGSYEGLKPMSIPPYGLDRDAGFVRDRQLLVKPPFMLSYHKELVTNKPWPPEIAQLVMPSLVNSSLMKQLVLETGPFYYLNEYGLPADTRAYFDMIVEGFAGKMQEWGW